MESKTQMQNVIQQCQEILNDCNKIMDKYTIPPLTHNNQCESFDLSKDPMPVPNDENQRILYFPRCRHPKVQINPFYCKIHSSSTSTVPVRWLGVIQSPPLRPCDLYEDKTVSYVCHGWNAVTGQNSDVTNIRQCVNNTHVDSPTFPYCDRHFELTGIPNANHHDLLEIQSWTFEKSGIKFK
jgi:hypothetical protein